MALPSPNAASNPSASITNKSYTNLSGPGQSGGGGGGGGGGGSGVTQLLAGTNVTLSPPTGTGIVTVNASGGGTSNGDYINPFDYGAVGNGTTNDRAAFVTADSKGGTICIPAGTFLISTSLTLSSPVVLVGGKLDIASGQTLTLSGGLSGPRYHGLTGSGLYALGSPTVSAFPEWFGALLGGDDGAIINTTLAACRANLVPITYIGNYQIGTTVTYSNPIPTISEVNAQFTANGATNGLLLALAGGNFNQRIGLPKISGFSGYGIRFYGTSLTRAFCPLISACGVGLELYMDGTQSFLGDNTIEVQTIAQCTTAGIQVNAVASGMTTQGNRVFGNFLLSNKAGVKFTAGSSGAQNWDSNTFEFEALDANGVSSAFGFVNTAAAVVNRNRLFINTWFGGFNTGTPSYVSGAFDGCWFIFGWNDAVTNYSYFSVTGAAGLSGNRYDAYGDQNAGTIAAQTAANTRSSFNSGSPITANGMTLTMTLTGNLASGAIQNFYAYHIYVDGAAKLSFTPLSMQGCLVNILEDTSSTNPNEILIQVFNTSGATISAGTVLSLGLVVGISGGGGGGGGGGTVTSSVYEYNVVVTYGADPTGVADSTAAFSAAISDINSSTFGGRLVIPHGQYKIGSALVTITNNCDIWGAGKGVTQMNFGTGVDGFKFDFSSTGRRCASAHAMTLDTGSTTAAQTALTYKQFNNAVTGNPFSFYDLEFASGWGTSINVNNTAQNNIQGSSIYDCYFNGSLSPNAVYGISITAGGNISIWGCKIFQVGIGIFVSGTPLTEGVWISDSMVVNCNIGVYSQGNNTWCKNVHVNISTSYGTSGYGMLFQGNQNHADHCYFLGNDATAIAIATTGTYDIISNCRILNNSGVRWATGIQVSGGSGQKVSSCAIFNCSGPAVDLTGSSYADADNISFNDIIGATALVAGTNSFIRNSVGLGSNTDTSWTPGHY